MRRFLLAALLLVSALPVFGAEKIFTLSDPRGDDYGDGKLLYPKREDMGKGDLDIISFSVHEEGGDAVFEAVFARSITKTWRRTIDDIGQTLDQVARYGFYTFNIDVYIDTDRKPASGNTTTLPGRKAEIDPAFAWEKAICLTPRPNEAVEVLKKMKNREERENLQGEKGGRLTPEEKAAVKKEVTFEVEKTIHFPTRVQVGGPTVKFRVPLLFLGGQVSKDWAYIVFVTAPDIRQTFDLSSAIGLTEASQNLMVLPIQPSGPYRDTLGGGQEENPYQPPIIDIIVPKNRDQKEVLADKGGRTPVPVKLPGVVPSQN